MGYVYRLNIRTGRFDIVLDDALLHMKDPVATYNDLPITGNKENDSRYVKDTDILWVWSIAASSGTLADWKETVHLSIISLIVQEDLTGQIDGIKTDFVISNAYQSGKMKVWLNGIKEYDIGEIDDTTVQVSPAPLDGDTLECEYLKKA